ncbi:MAG: hypothetical protein PW735_11175 [Acidobacteriaceae bacterium]|nr:hypothetical protein [Acidobacteriaceae bacterium]
MKNAPQMMKSQDIPITNPDELRSVYANSVGASASLTDVRLFFTEVGADPTNAKGVQELKAFVTIPLTTAQALHNTLQQVLDGQKQLVEALKAANGTPVVKQ